MASAGADWYVYLDGGPCDGRRIKGTTEIADTGTVICKNAVYRPDAHTKHRANGDLIFRFQKNARPPATSSTARGMHGYNHFARSVAHTLPTALRRSKLIRAQAKRRLHVPRKLGG